MVVVVVVERLVEKGGACRSSVNVAQDGCTRCGLGGVAARVCASRGQVTA